ncbi:hypothetical protein ASE35_14500 [Lysobacter sp. Root916]|uniref:hypothetical protein n=1 Tax=Lysobacter sp. Root916 TaxID=1736606 RepID=UPI00070A16A3|nr:hypothetical protein [Lysobacter sp. Root916]KRD32144.1 hypothetical protein ASE35_14500 [Lysobacter sp. Root916]
MKTSIVLVVLAGLGMAGGCSRVFGYEEVLSETYATYSEAATKRAFESGWLPKEMPRSARSIVEVHNVDTGELWLRFRYGSGDIAGLLANCAARPALDLPDRRRTQRSTPWWPEYLAKDSQGPSPMPLGLYSCPKMSHAGSIYPAGIAVDRETETVWYWITR